MIIYASCWHYEGFVLQSSRLRAPHNKLGFAKQTNKIEIIIQCLCLSVRVFSALMDILDDNELLGVIGHEIGHAVTQRDKRTA